MGAPPWDAPPASSPLRAPPVMVESAVESGLGAPPPVPVPRPTLSAPLVSAEQVAQAYGEGEFSQEGGEPPLWAPGLADKEPEIVD